MLIRATWKVTFAGITLLEFTDCMESEARVPRSEEGESVPLIGAANAGQFARGNVTQTIIFSRVKVFLEAADALDFLLTHVAALPVGVHDATIELRAGSVFTLKGARLLPIEPSTEANRFLAKYTLIGGKITKTLSELTTDAGDTRVTDSGDTIAVNP